ncbi:MAG: hypothetical protein ACYDCQ_09010 [Dehalococcoidia bacterium]
MVGEERGLFTTTDDETIAAMGGVVQVHRNSTNWYNNASFALPLAAAVVVLIAGLVLRNGGLLGFAGFLFVVTACMAPVVLVSWRQTATAVVLSTEAITSLHDGRVLKALPWTAVTAVSRRETQGNVRWIVAADGGERIALDGELDNLDRLVETARRLAALAE